MSDTNFFKRLPRRRTGANQQEAELANARNSIYRWWYEYLKLNKDYWEMIQTRHQHSAINHFKNVWNGFGDVYKSDFDTWWLSQGRYLFAEQQKLRSVKQLDIHSIALADFNEGQIVLTVPLTIRKATVMRQIRNILKQYYDIKYDVLQHSTANFKLYTGRYRLEAIVVAYEVWITHRKYVTLKPEGEKLTLWEIGNMLKLSSAGNSMLGNSPKEIQEKNRVMNAMVSRYLRKANALIKNVANGKFPCYEDEGRNNISDTKDRIYKSLTERQRKALTERDAQWDALEFVFPDLT